MPPNSSIASLITSYNCENYRRTDQACTGGTNILYLDDGFRSYSQLEILRQMFHRLKYDLQSEDDLRPCDWFDMIIGSGHAGLIAIMLGRLQMTVSEAFKAYLALATAGKATTKNSNRRQEIIKHILMSCGLNEDTKMVDNALGGCCKTLVFLASNSTAEYRSYPFGDDSLSNSTIAEALEHIAMSNDYEPGDMETYSWLFKEVGNVFGKDGGVATFVNIGADKADVQTKSHSNTHHSDSNHHISDIHRGLELILGAPEIYFRLTVDKLPTLLGDEMKYAHAVKSFTILHLERKETSRNLDEILSKMQCRVSGYSFEEISTRVQYLAFHLDIESLTMCLSMVTKIASELTTFANHFLDCFQFDDCTKCLAMLEKLNSKSAGPRRYLQELTRWLQIFTRHILDKACKNSQLYSCFSDASTVGNNHGLSRKLHQEILGLRKIIYGGTHLKPIKAETELASAYFVLGEDKALEELRREALKIRKASVGDERRAIVKAIHNLGETPLAPSEHNEAEFLLQKVLMRRDEILDPHHPSTIKAGEILAKSYFSSGKTGEAGYLHNIAKFIREIWEPKHQDVITAWTDLADINVARNVGRARKMKREDLIRIRLENILNLYPYITRDIVGNSPLSTVEQNDPKGPQKELPYLQDIIEVGMRFKLVHIVFVDFRFKHMIPLGHYSGCGRTIWESLLLFSPWKGLWGFSSRKHVQAANKDGIPRVAKERGCLCGGTVNHGLDRMIQPKCSACETSWQ